MSHETGAIEGLPENARRPMEPGEVYIPIVPDEAGVYEVTARSVTLGLMFCALFAMGAAFLAVRVGQGIEAAIPIAILAIGLSPLFSRKSTILENVIIQSIGANSAPETTCDEFAPMDWTMTFSSSVVLRAKRGAIPMARIEIGIAASIP